MATYLAQVRGLVWRNGRLVTLDLTGWNLENQVLDVHPADQSFKSFGWTGYKWGSFPGFASDPTTGAIYATWDRELYVLDQNTGNWNHVASVFGLPGLDSIVSMAIDANGIAYGSGIGGVATLYQVDLSTGDATSLGPVAPMSVGNGYFNALAFDSSGQLWGVYMGYFANYSGIYKIDISTLTAQLVLWGNHGIRGMAFGPATPETVYCTPKAGSTGCVPTIRSAGFASTTASLGYDVYADGVRNSSYGMLVYSTLGPASTPFAGGTLCITSPWQRTKVLHSGGSPPTTQDCTGNWSYDLNTHFANKPGPAPGDTIWCQWLGRDPGFQAGQNYALSNALEFTLLP